MSTQFQLEKKNDVLVFYISGKLLENTDNHPLILEVEEQLNSYKKFVFNLAELSTMNSSGINLFIKLFTKIRNTGGELYFCALPKSIEQLLIVTKLNSIFTISTDLETALIKFKSQDA
jgi:stage II sporulation protein AA (anti-sigma F factor antagonist)